MLAKNVLTIKQAHLQFAQANAQTKNCKRACFANEDKNCFLKKKTNASKKIKLHQHTARQTQ